MSDEKNILITGATGTVGSAILEAISSKYSNIKALYRNRFLQTKNVHWIKFDISSYDDAMLAEAVKNSDVIIHNAASLLLGRTPEEKQIIHDTNIKFTQDLLNHAVKEKVKKIIFTSSLSSIKKPLPPLITEEAALETTSYYSESKLAGEHLIIDYAKRYGIHYNILRISSPVNFNIDLMPDTVVKKWIVQSQNAQTIRVYGAGKRTQDFVAVSDIASAFINCIEKNIDGIFNIASGNTLSMLQVAEMVTAKYKNSYEFFGEDENENDRWNISIEDAKKYLGYQPKYTSKDVINELLNQSVK